MNKFSIQAAALILAMSATAAMASAQTASAGGTPKPLGSSSMNSSTSGSMSGTKTTTKKVKKSSLARHGPPIDAAGANSGSSGNPASGADIPSTTGATTGKAK